MNENLKIKYKAFELDINIHTNITSNVYHKITPSVPNIVKLSVNPPPNHSRVLVLHMLIQQSLPAYIIVYFKKAYYSSPPEDDTTSDMNVILPHN